MKTIIACITLVIITTSCGVFDSLTSNTTIKPNDSFILGNNEHQSFKVHLKNVSKVSLDIYKAPINGGTHSRETIQPNQQVKIEVDKNTALVIENKSNETCNVELKVTGDTGLSMGYKN